MFPKTPHNRVRGLLALLLLAGVALMIVSHWIPWGTGNKIAKELGVAVFVAGLLGLTVDWVLKVELIQEVLQSAFAYVLPPELKDEVARIIGYKFLCTDHHMVVEIVPIDSALVRVRVMTERTLKNASHQPEAIRNQLAVDEWAFPGNKSRIERCSLEFGGETIDGRDDPEYASKPDAIGWITDERTVNRDTTVKVVSIGSEVCRRNGQIFMSFRTPTVRPMVDVVVPEGFQHVCNFGAPDAKTVSSQITNRYILDGTQFPGQYIRVRWWESPTPGQVDE